LIGYWHNFTNPAGATFHIKDVSSSWDVIVVAFADNAGSGNVSFTLDPAAGTEAQFIQEIKDKQAQGKKVVLSIGGQNGSVSLGSAAEVTNFVNSMSAIITKFGFNGIDLDLESGVSLGAPIINNLITGVKQVKARVGTGSNFYLSMAPEHPYVQGAVVAYGSIWGAYLPIIDGLRGDLTVLHVQLYNNGGLQTPYSGTAYAAGTEDMLVGSVKMLIEGFTRADGGMFAGLRADQVAFGLPSGPSSANSGMASTGTISSALNCVTRGTNCATLHMNANQPNFRGVMTWSINWDKHDGFNFSVPVKSALNSLP
jgi:chitinase